MKYLLLSSLLVAGASAHSIAAIKIKYAEPEPDAKNVEHIVEIKNDYEEQLQKLKEENERLIAERKAAEEFALAEAKRKGEEDARRAQEAKVKEKLQAKVDQDYRLSVDLTKKVINHMGQMPASLPSIASEGVEAPLSAAFGAVIPLDWKVYVHHSIDDQQAVSWDSEGRNWAATLYQIGVRHGLSFDVNWEDQWVLVNESELRLGLSSSSKPDIEIMGLNVPPGTEGHILIDGKVIKVKSKRR